MYIIIIYKAARFYRGKWNIIEWAPITRAFHEEKHTHKYWKIYERWLIWQRVCGIQVEEVNLEDEDDMQEAISLSNKVNSYLV